MKHNRRPALNPREESNPIRVAPSRNPTRALWLAVIRVSVIDFKAHRHSLALRDYFFSPDFIEVCRLADCDPGAVRNANQIY